MTDQRMVEFIVSRFEKEKFTNDPLDAGGPTKWGVTQRLYSAFMQRPATVDDIRGLTFDRACEVMREMFLMRTGIWLVVDWRLRFVVLDASINFGAGDGVRWLQQAVGARADGALGPQTRAAIAKTDGLKAATRVLALRLEKHSDRVRRKPDQARFLRGWLNRCTVLLKEIVTD